MGAIPSVVTATMVLGFGFVFVAWALPPVPVAAGPFLVLPLFSRLDAARASEHPVRSRVLDALRHATGDALTLRQLQQATGHSVGRVRHHVEALKRLGSVSSQRVGSTRFYGLPDRLPRLKTRPAADAAGLTVGALILQLVASQPRSLPSLVEDLRRWKGVTRHAVWKQVRELRRRGFVHIERRQGVRWVSTQPQPRP